MGYVDLLRHGRRKVFLLGQPHVLHEGDEQVLGPDLRHQLLAYLAYDGGWVERARLAALFWGDSEEQTASQNLRQLLQRSRRLPWAADLEVDRRHLRWQVWTDVAAQRSALTAGELSEAEALDRGALMDGLEGHASNEFAAWLELERERAWTDLRDGLLQLAEARSRAHDHAGADAALDRILRRDPYDEEAVAARLAAAAAAGRPAAALKAYRSFADRLQSELGLAPSAGTQGLVALLERPTAVSPAVPPAAAPAASQAMGAAQAIQGRDGEVGTSFVGRDLELAAVAERFSRPEGRLVTLTGPSGMGKTRLARECGRELLGRFPDGVVFVPLLDVADPAGLPRAVAAALGIWLQGDGQDLTRLSLHLAEKQMLLILDNFEHIMGAASAVAQLLAAAPRLSVLVTSHQRLDLAREWVVPVEGLAMPSAEASLADALQYDAVDLFVQRARRLDPGFELAAADLPAILDICRLVDRSPLGIELAAAWVRLLPLAEIAEQIGATLDFLRSRAPDLPERHRSLQAAFDYTWKLLSTCERETMARLSVFRGGFGHAAANSVAGAHLALLAALGDKSLLKTGHEGRFEVHPQLRHFLGNELARLPGEPKLSRDRHLRYFLAMVEGPEGRAVGPGFRSHRARLAAEADNLRAALDWAAAGGSVESGLRLAAPLLGLWTGRGDLRSVRAQLARLLELAGETAPSAALAMTLNAAGSLSMFLAEFEAAERYLSEGKAMAEALGSPAERARLRISLGSVALRKGQRPQARQHYLEARALLQTHPDLEAITGLLNNLGALAVDEGENDEALGWLEEAMAHLGTVADPALTATVLYNAGWAAWHAGQGQRAFELLQRSLEASRSVGAVLREAGALNTIALLEIARGNLAAAEKASAEALRLRARMGDRFGLTFSLEARALLAAHREEAHRAAKLLGAVHALRAQLGAPLGKGWAGAVEEARGLATATLGQEAFRSAFDIGALSSLEAAVTLAAEGGADGSLGRGSPGRGSLG